jgi:hypothetical protein
VLRAIRLPLSSHALLLAAEIVAVVLAMAGVLVGPIVAALTLTALGAAWLSGRLSRPDHPSDTQTGREAVTDALGADPWTLLPAPRAPIRHAADPRKRRQGGAPPPSPATVPLPVGTPAH